MQMILIFFHSFRCGSFSFGLVVGNLLEVFDEIHFFQLLICMFWDIVACFYGKSGVDLKAFF